MVKHTVEINGHQSSLSLEPEFWLALRSMANESELPLCELVSRISRRPDRRSNLSSEVRVRLLQWYQGDGFRY
jgi:predicted DNA-binding ribbon-helix-helix protein